jgi:hypothetical protein
LQEGGLNQGEADRLEKLKEDLKSSYGVEDNSKEQKDLELLEKAKIRKEALTQEERDRLSQMGPLTEYQEAAFEYSKDQVEFKDRAEAAAEDYFNENRTITAMKLEMLKDDPMVDAKKDAEELLDKVDAEIQQAMIEEIKNRVNENLDIDPNSSILDNPQALINQKKVTEEDLKGLAVDEKV